MSAANWLPGMLGTATVASQDMAITKNDITVTVAKVEVTSKKSNGAEANVAGIATWSGSITVVEDGNAPLALYPGMVVAFACQVTGGGAFSTTYALLEEMDESVDIKGNYEITLKLSPGSPSTFTYRGHTYGTAAT